METNFGFKDEPVLPLCFKYLEVRNADERQSQQIGEESYLKCKKYQTEFYSKQVLHKPITRML
ncbi:MAG: hypothetical protein EOP00_02475 [Pedobacter sp.]|nr:MAG: hypothetical protein EOP00_02475 [Pedobacter sp.]